MIDFDKISEQVTPIAKHPRRFKEAIAHYRDNHQVAPDPMSAIVRSYVFPVMFVLLDDSRFLGYKPETIVDEVNDFVDAHVREVSQIEDDMISMPLIGVAVSGYDDDPRTIVASFMSSLCEQVAAYLLSRGQLTTPLLGDTQ